MGNTTFIGRSNELKQLNQYAKTRSASFIVIKGRRRVGKSSLIEQIGQQYKFHEFVGLLPNEKTTKQSQLDDFANQLSLEFKLPGITADNWNALFKLLAMQIQKGRVVILLDEISWIGSKDSDFLGKLKTAWDTLFKKNPELILIVCGSASSWIEKNILSSSAFVGRVSYTLTLEELSLPECNEFWGNDHISYYEKCKMLCITGGIPRYLEEIDIKLSAENNIHHLCFNKGGILTTEFKKIFSDLFGKRSEKYRSIISCLVDQSLEYGALCDKLNVEKTGAISKYLNDLIMSGFVKRDHTWNTKTGISAPKLFKYRLSDNYLRFYLKYIEPRLPEIERDLFEFKSMETLPGWTSIMGLQFENLVLNNRHFIIKSIDLEYSDILTENPFFQHKTVRQKGCQIDYMIQTKSNVLYLCEIKFSKHPIGKHVIEEMQKKVKNLSRPKGMSCLPVLIHINGVCESVEDGNYFNKIIDFSDAFSANS